MSARLGENRYGESAIRVLKLTRRGDRHDLRDLTVDVAFDGDFEDSHTRGENARILPAHTMRNTVYALARDHAAGDVEKFALALANHFYADVTDLRAVHITVAEEPWTRVAVGARPHGSAFSHGPGERRLAVVERNVDGLAVEAGLDGLSLVKTRNAAFEGFLRGRFTTLPDTADRLMATELTARWRYGWSEVPFAAQWRQVRQVLLETFAEHDSRSLQHTLFVMAQAALDQCPPLASIHLRLDAFHPQLVDLSPFSMENTEVYGGGDSARTIVEATVGRDELAG
jgi:urate oxidase